MQHFWYSVSGDHVDGLDLLNVSLSCRGGGSTPNESFDYVIYD